MSGFSMLGIKYSDVKKMSREKLEQECTNFRDSTGKMIDLYHRSCDTTARLIMEKQMTTDAEAWDERILDLRCKKLHDDAQLPETSEGNIGWDLRCVADENFFTSTYPGRVDGKYFHFRPGQSHIFHTGLAIAVPDGYAALLWDRSGMGAKRNIHRLAGVIDCSYRGEWLIALVNLSGDTQRICAGDKIIQFIIQKEHKAKARWVEELDETARGAKGFGSSGN